MARKRTQRRQLHGSAWHWKWTNCWYYTPPGTKQWMPSAAGDCRLLRPEAELPVRRHRTPGRRGADFRSRQQVLLQHRVRFPVRKGLHHANVFQAAPLHDPLLDVLGLGVGLVRTCLDGWPRQA